MGRKLTDFLSRFYFAVIMVFLYIPIAVMIVLSFNNSRSRVVWGGFTLEWYRTLLENEQIREALVTTLALAFGSSAIALVIGVAAALGMYYMQRRSYTLMLGLTNIPMLNADIVTGISLMLWFIRFMKLGFTSVLLAHITFNIPYIILAVMPRIRQMNVSIYEASRDLGANAVYGFFTTILPQLRGGIISGFFMALTMSMDDFVITYFTKGAGVNTLSTMIYGEIRKGIKPEMYALSTLLFVTVLGILVIANIYSRAEEKRHPSDERESLV